MAGEQFTVHTDTLRTAADALGDRSGDASDIADKAGEADVETKSWGLLGLGLGLYEGYTSARNSANRSIGEVQSFLASAQSAVQRSASDYDQADQAGSQSFSEIQGAS